MQTTNLALALILATILTVSASAQPEQQKVVVVNEKVGEKIDAEERARYGLFPAVEDFASAQFIQNSDGSLVLQIVTEKNGRSVTKNIPVAAVTLSNIAAAIDTYQKVDKDVSGGASPTPELDPTKQLLAMQKERRDGPQPFAGYLGSLFGGGVTLLWVAELGMELDTRLDIYLTWGLGSAFVSALTINGLGKFGRGSEMFGSTFIGTLLGSALGVLLVEGSYQTNSEALLAMSVLFAKPILTSWGGIKGYYTAAERRARTGGYGLLNLNNHKLVLAVPHPEITVSPGTGRYDPVALSYRINLLHIAL